MLRTETVDTLILGAGAAGLFCAGFAARGGGRVLLIDHAKAPGDKIRISGGGRCNFTNLRASPENFISQNRHFAKSALKRYTQWDFVDLVARYDVPYHEKTLGQLFCDTSARDIIDLLLAEMKPAELRLNTQIVEVAKTAAGFSVTLETEGARYAVAAQNLVVATGGKSIPKMGATGLGYRLAEQFDLSLIDTRPALVPLTFGGELLDELKSLAGVAADAVVRSSRAAFEEAALFTHRGLSGPAILQISSYWREGEAITVGFAPGVDLSSALKVERASNGRRAVSTVLAQFMPKRLSQHLCDRFGARGNLADLSDKRLSDLIDQLTTWELTPTGSEGYRTAEVTLGGVDTDGLSSKTMETKTVPGLYFIGEGVDVTGWLGGYNFQWAWSSAWAAGTAIASQTSAFERAS
ncbi:MAG: NAD(P)/FAD-dependent oxidoreductase [Neomegalonema sp.]